MSHCSWSPPPQTTAPEKHVDWGADGGRSRHAPGRDASRALAGTPARGVVNDRAARMGRGPLSLMDDKQRDADRLLRQALEAAPELRPPMRLLAVIHERKRDVRGLIQFIDQEIRATRHPREAAALYRERGLVVESQFGDLEAATQCFHAAVQASDPGPPVSARRGARLPLQRRHLGAGKQPRVAADGLLRRGRLRAHPS